MVGLPDTTARYKNTTAGYTNATAGYTNTTAGYTKATGVTISSTLQSAGMDLVTVLN